MVLTVAQSKPWYDLSILGPYSIPISTLTTVSSQVLAADPARAGVFFHNPGTVMKRILPAGSTLVGGSGGILLPPQADYQIIRDDNSQFNVNCAWIAVTDDNSDTALTVLDFTPNTPNAAEVVPTMRVQQQIPVASPVATPVLLGTGSVQVLPADTARNGVQFHNPGSVSVAVCPSNLAAQIGPGSIIIFPGLTKTIMGNDRVKINCAWNAIAASGSNNALTCLSFYG